MLIVVSCCFLLFILVSCCLLLFLAVSCCCMLFLDMYCCFLLSLVVSCGFLLFHVVSFCFRLFHVVVSCCFSLCQLVPRTSPGLQRFKGIPTAKRVRTPSVLYILTSKCASRHNSVHFFDIATSKSGPSILCFVHFDFEMCFAPQRRALFPHLNFQKWSEPLVFCTF